LSEDFTLSNNFSKDARNSLSYPTDTQTNWQTDKQAKTKLDHVRTTEIRPFIHCVSEKTWCRTFCI